MDPSLAIYPRELGALLLLSGDARTANTELTRAVQLNPLDDLAWRTLGLALWESGDRESARVAIDHAVTVQRSDPSNLLLALRIQIDAGDAATARATAAQIVQAWPAIAATHQWRELMAKAGISAVAEMALDLWKDGRPSPEPLFAQPLMLRALTGKFDGTLGPGESRLDRPLSQAYVAVMACDPTAASALAAVPDEDKRQATYWALSVRLAQLRHEDHGRAARMFTIMTGDSSLESGKEPMLNPLNENGARGSSADRWGYRRPTVVWPSTRWDLPSPASGFVIWHLHPALAIEAASLQERLPGCL
jgi:hypothetical protein